MNPLDWPSEPYVAALAALTPGGALAIGGSVVHTGQASPLWTLVGVAVGTQLGAYVRRRWFGGQANEVRVARLVGSSAAGLATALAVSHVFVLLPLALSIALQAGAVAMIAWVLRRRLRQKASWRQLLDERDEPWLALAIVAVVIGRWWPQGDGDAAALARAALADRQARVIADSLSWIDAQRSGLANVARAARGVVLAEKAGTTDVFLLRFALSHDGRPARVVGVYNVTQTSAVDEVDLVVRDTWAAWQIRAGESTNSVELADFRGEKESLGREWSRLSRAQRAVTNLQEVGQAAGIARVSLTLSEPLAGVDVDLEGDSLAVDHARRTWTFPLTREGFETQSDLGHFARHPATLPGNLTTWAVDRVRAVPWIGSNGMQWIKALVFRTTDRLEQLSEEVAPTDAREAIADELGSLMDSLPAAKDTRIPGWPPAPLETRISPSVPGEGQWVTFAEDLLVGGQREGPSPFLFTFVRVDPKRPYTQVAITLWDARRVRLQIVAGTQEPKSTTGVIGAGLIPRDPAVLGRLLAAFNGAFQSLHGEFGMMAERQVLLPPKPYGATVADMADGSTGFGTWPKDQPIPDDMASYRQNMTPLFVDGAPNPYKRHWWGGVPEGWTEETRTVRSALCVTSEGFVAYFYSASVDPEALAEAMRRCRCSYGLHLDMNAGHTGFEFYRIEKKGSMPPPVGNLDRYWEARGEVPQLPELEYWARLMVRKMPLMNFPRYVYRVSRDYFYLTERVLLPRPSVEPFEGASAGEGQWRILGIDGWPPAAAVTRISVPVAGDRVSVTLTQVDAKQVAVEKSDEPVVVVTTPLDDGESAVWLSAGGFHIAPKRSAPDTGVVAYGRATASTTARAAACTTSTGIVTFARTDAPHTEAIAALTSSLERAGCEPQMWFDQTFSIGRAAPTISAAIEARHVALGRRAPTGARRIFEQTPVVPPSEWAPAQRRRAPFTPSSP